MITVNTGSALHHYLTEPGIWAVAPLSVVRALGAREDLAWYRMQNGPGPRTCYQLTNRYAFAARQDLVTVFTAELKQYIRENEDMQEVEAEE